MSARKHIKFCRAAMGLLVLAGLLPVHGIPPRSRPRLEDFDKRARIADKQLPESKREGLQHLKELAPNAQVDWDPVLGTPHWVRAERGFLTDKGGSGKAVPKAVADRLPLTDPDRALKGFL